MIEDAAGGGRFARVELRPRVTLAAGADGERALALHEVAHSRCFIANSVSCEVAVLPTFKTYQAV